MKTMRRVAYVSLMIVLAVLALVGWLNYYQDITVRLARTADAGVVSEEIASENHELCIRSQQEVILLYGIWPVRSRSEVMIDIVGECEHSTTRGKVGFALHLDKKFDQEVIKNGRLCLLVHYSYLNSADAGLRLKLYCE
jgi:hypothetical protein